MSLLLAGLLGVGRLAAQIPVRIWDRTIGGPSADLPFSLRQTADGGIIIGGPTSSEAGGDRTQPLRGSADYWLVKLDAQGNQQWDRRFGGSGEDQLTVVRPTVDGGYILGGFSSSGVSGDKTQPSRGQKDFWLVKLDAQGNAQWDRTLGGNLDDALTSLELTTDGGYIVGGWSHSDATGDKSQPNRGPTPSADSFDYWVVKLTATGQKQWDRTLGGANRDELRQVRQTLDGGFLAAGSSLSGVSGEKTQPGQGGSDYGLVKLNATGGLEWDRTYGGAGVDALLDLVLTTDGGYALAGYSSSRVSGDKTQPPQGDNSDDFWLLKLDARGTKQWDRTVGGAYLDHPHSVVQTADGGYVLSGVSYSGISGDKSTPGRGAADYWLVKLDGVGAKQWDRTYGGSNTDAALALDYTAAGSLVLGGVSYSPVSEDKTQPGRGDADFWVLKLQMEAGVQPGTVHISGPAKGCVGRPVVLTAVVSAAPQAYVWNTGAITPSISVTASGNYSVAVTFADGQVITTQHVVQLESVPASFQLGTDTTLCEGQQIRLRGPTGAGYRYRWSDGSGQPTLLVQQPGTYALEVSTDCATQTASRFVAYQSCVNIPNIITPNGDSRNEHFAPAGLGPGPWVLTLYNRWGQEIYRSIAYQNDWGATAVPGLYYYRLERAQPAAAHRGWLEVVR